MKKDRCCLDCETDVFDMREYYMVHTAVWKAAVPDKKEQRGMLCIGCLEKRLGRKLDFRDFNWLPINLDGLFDGSKRLRDRLNAADMLASLIRAIHHP